MAAQEHAEAVALRGLGWLAATDDLLPVFLGTTGASPDEVRARAADPAFLGAVLDFILMDDTWVMGFCDAAGLDYEAPRAARQALPGGQQVHWT